MSQEDSDTIVVIYKLLPSYWGIWRNRFGDWSIGEIGGKYENEKVVTQAEAVGSLVEMLKFAKNKFGTK